MVRIQSSALQCWGKEVCSSLLHRHYSKSQKTASGQSLPSPTSACQSLMFCRTLGFTQKLNMSTAVLHGWLVRPLPVNTWPCPELSQALRHTFPQRTADCPHVTRGFSWRAAQMRCLGEGSVHLQSEVAVPGIESWRHTAF